MIFSFGFSIEEISKPSFIPALMDTKKYWPLVISFLIQSVGLFVIPSLLFNWFAKKSNFQYFTFKKNRYLKFLLLLPFLALSGVIIVSFFGYLNMQLDLPEYFVNKENSTNETIKFILSFRDSPHILMNILLLAIIPAVGEELFFRGVLQKIFVSWTRKNWIGILITAAIFSAIHFQFLTFLPRFFMGIMLGYLLVWSKNLWIPIIAHFLHNFVSIMIGIFYSKEDLGGTEPPNVILILISVIVMSGIGYYYYSLSKKEHVS